jgi:hypothetical protein
MQCCGSGSGSVSGFGFNESGSTALEKWAFNRRIQSGFYINEVT